MLDLSADLASDRVAERSEWYYDDWSSSMTSDVRPGREHDTTAIRAHEEILPLVARIRDDLRTLADLGYEGESDTITVAFKKPANGELTDIQQQFNKAHNGLRALGERRNSLLKTTFKALRNVSICPWKDSVGKCINRTSAMRLTTSGPCR